MFSIQLIRSKLYDWRRARAEVIDFRSSTTNFPFSLLQDKLMLLSPRWNFTQEHQLSAAGVYVPASAMQARIQKTETVMIRRRYQVVPEAFIGFQSTGSTPAQFMNDMPLNTDFRVFIIELPNGDRTATFPRFEDVIPHTRAGLRGRIDGRGVLTVTDIILNGQQAPYSSLWPQRGVMRVINVISQLVEQIESGVPYNPVAAQRSAWRTSAKLPRPQPPYYRRGRAAEPAQKPRQG